MSTLLIALGFVGATALALYLIFGPAKQEPRDERRAIGQEVLDEALQKAKSQVGVPKEAEQRFVARFWSRLSRLFKL